MFTNILEKISLKNQAFSIHPKHFGKLKKFINYSRELDLVNECIHALIKQPDDLEKYGELILKRVDLERKIKPENPPNTGVCISPEWESIGSLKHSERGNFHQQNLTLELQLIRLSKVKRQTKAKHKNSKLSIIEVLEKAGIQHKNWFILCCFHVERNPSLRIYANTNTFYCFGCGRYGDAYDLAKALGVKI